MRVDVIIFALARFGILSVESSKALERDWAAHRTGNASTVTAKSAAAYTEASQKAGAVVLAAAWLVIEPLVTSARGSDTRHDPRSDGTSGAR